MNDNQFEVTGHPSPGEGEVDLAALLRHAGRRPAPPEEVAERIYRHTHAAWLEEVQVRRRRRWMLSLVAGAALAVVAISAMLYETPAPAAQVATIGVTTGKVSIERAGLRHAAATGVPLLAGDIVETGSAGAIAARRLDGLEVRLGAQSRFVWHQVADLTLDLGNLYVDSGLHAGGGRPLTIATPVGRIEHLGTQYSVAVDGRVTTVAVRDGRIRVTPAAGVPTDMAKGQAARIGGSAGLERLTAVSDVDWAWADALGARIAIESRSLAAVLEQVAQSDGMRVAYLDAEVEQKARQVQLHGDDLQLPARDIVQAVVATTGFVARIESDQIIVSLQHP